MCLLLEGVWGVSVVRVWGGVWGPPAADAYPARADGLIASPSAPGHRRPRRLRPCYSSGSWPHPPGRRVRPPRTPIDRDGRPPHRSTGGPAASRELPRPGRRGRPLGQRCPLVGGKGLPSLPAASSRTGSRGLALRAELPPSASSPTMAIGAAWIFAPFGFHLPFVAREAGLPGPSRILATWPQPLGCGRHRGVPCALEPSFR